MAFESTITEKDMDTAPHTLAQGIRGDKADFEPDLSVDGLSDSILAKLLRLGLLRLLPYHVPWEATWGVRSPELLLRHQLKKQKRLKKLLLKKQQLQTKKNKN